MNVVVREQPVEFLERYATIPIAFEVRECYDVLSTTDGSHEPRTRVVDPPYIKDYDAIPNHRPTDWPRQFDVRNWRFAGAFVDAELIGAVTLVIDSPKIALANTCAADAIVWDIRVSPHHRGRGVGRALLTFAEQCARDAGKRFVNIETQNINVPACRFYAANGYTVHSVHRSTYPELPDEIQLIWRKAIDQRAGPCAPNAALIRSTSS